MSDKEFLQGIIDSIKKEHSSGIKNWRGTLSNWIKC